MAKPDGPQFEKYYHGTSEKNAESIMKKGLKMSNPAAGLYDDDYEETGHPTGVYLGDLETARGYGGAVFEVDLPAKHDNWGWTESEGHVWTANIPPKKIRRVE
jgi:hypothetical protein